MSTIDSPRRKINIDVSKTLEGMDTLEIELMLSRIETERASTSEKIRAGIIPIPEIVVSGKSIAIVARKVNGRFDILGLPPLLQVIAKTINDTGKAEIIIPHFLAQLLASAFRIARPNIPHNFTLEDIMEEFFITETPRALNQDHKISVEVDYSTPISSSPYISDEAKKFNKDFGVIYKRKSV